MHSNLLPAASLPPPSISLHSPSLFGLHHQHNSHAASASRTAAPAARGRNRIICRHFATAQRPAFAVKCDICGWAEVMLHNYHQNVGQISLAEVSHLLHAHVLRYLDIHPLDLGDNLLCSSRRPGHAIRALQEGSVCYDERCHSDLSQRSSKTHPCTSSPPDASMFTRHQPLSTPHTL